MIIIIINNNQTHEIIENHEMKTKNNQDNIIITRIVIFQKWNQNQNQNECMYE